MTAELLAMQAPNGVPRSTLFETVSDPLLPPSKTTDMLAHFFEDIYDLRSESHLSRLLKILLGDTGTGQLRKRYTYAHLSQFILTAHYNDLDRLYASVFGLGRFLRERLTFDPYSEAATDEEWEAIDAADAAYRNRVEAFSRAIQWAGTPNGMVMAAMAVLGEECRVYESYTFQDDSDVYAESGAISANTYGDLEAYRYGDLDGRTYAALEGDSLYTGRLPNSRGEFIIRPLRDVTPEERYHLTKVLSRLKPAEALMSIDPRPASLHTPVAVARASASSSYWHVQSRVQIDPDKAALYDRVDPLAVQVPQEQPKYAFSSYQGEAWSYNSDVVSIEAYSEDDSGAVVQAINYERLATPSGTRDYSPDLSLQTPAEILMGRAVSDGVISTPVTARGA